MLSIDRLVESRTGATGKQEQADCMGSHQGEGSGQGSESTLCEGGHVGTGEETGGLGAMSGGGGVLACLQAVRVLQGMVG